MSKTIVLRESLKETIESALTQASFTAEVYYAQAKRDHGQPYIILTVEEVTRMDGRITYELEVNCIDYGNNTAQCENIADCVTAALDHTVTIEEEIEYHIYANRRNNVSSEDEKIIRRRLTFDLYLYERN